MPCEKTDVSTLVQQETESCLQGINIINQLQQLQVKRPEVTCNPGYKPPCLLEYGAPNYGEVSEVSRAWENLGRLHHR